MQLIPARDIWVVVKILYPYDLKILIGLCLIIYILWLFLWSFIALDSYY
jgi:hypothetical protein